MAKAGKFRGLNSNAAYPPSGGKPVGEEEMLDADPCDTYFAVGRMKRYTEIPWRSYSRKLENPMTTVAIRPSNICGPYNDFDYATSHMMGAIITKVVERHNPVKVWGTGNDIRDLIYVDDFIDALVLPAEKINTYDPMNMGLGKGSTIREIPQIILENDSYKDSEIVYEAPKPSMIPVRLIDTTKAEKVLGFGARTDMRERIRKTIK